MLSYPDISPLLLLEGPKPTMNVRFVNFKLVIKKYKKERKRKGKEKNLKNLKGRTNAIKRFNKIESSRFISCSYELIDCSRLGYDDFIAICDALDTTNTVSYTES